MEEKQKKTVLDIVTDMKIKEQRTPETSSTSANPLVKCSVKQRRDDTVENRVFEQNVCYLGVFLQLG